MEKFHLTHDVNVFGFRVQTFPQGISEAFGKLMQQVDDGKNRGYYGISKMDADGAVLYYVEAEEKFAGEAETLGYERYTIPKADYLKVTLHDWRNKLDSIKDIFHNMMQQHSVDNTKPCIEWYKTEEEMFCLLQIDPVKELVAAIDAEAAELLELLTGLTEGQLNKIPFKDSWTAAQLASHITKSNKGMAQALEMEGKPAERNATERAAELRDTFLNYNIKMKSPPFIVPDEGFYIKDTTIAALKKSHEQMKDKALKAGPNEMINLPAAFGEITKLELVHFVLYHTQRHIHQLKKIIACL